MSIWWDKILYGTVRWNENEDNGFSIVKYLIDNHNVTIKKYVTYVCSFGRYYSVIEYVINAFKQDFVDKIDFVDTKWDIDDRNKLINYLKSLKYNNNNNKL